MSAPLPYESDPTEPQVAALLRAVAGDAAAVDEVFMAALRARSLDAFTQAAKEVMESEENRGTKVSRSEIPNVQRPTTNDQSNQGTNVPRSGKGSRMFTLAFRGLAALATSVVLVIAWFNSSSGPAVSSVPFEKVLDNLRQAKSLQLRVTTGGKQAQVFVRASGMVRWEESPERYTIAAGSRFWKIDAANNSVTTGDSPWYLNPQHPVDLLGLLDLGVSDATPLLTTRPTAREEYNGRACEVYRVQLTAQTGEVDVQAYADAETHQLVALAAWPKGERVRQGAPLAELQLVALNPVVDAGKFVVAKTLSADGRVGKITDAQGIVLLRPLTAQRWTPIHREMPVQPGDWVRTELRGANAVRIKFTSEVELTLGPGTLVECISPTEARLHTGEAAVNVPAGEKSRFDLLAPRAAGQTFTVAGKSVWRANLEDKLAEVKPEPIWLAGFNGTSSNESLGSLIVNLPDGRNEPLTVGYHKVSVEIRDQIARTTIEESFVNHTAGRLEGTFHFPLPADASISGFGMWIGNELIEADVVEKQRAREIYETILRENRDPGLLERAGGNIFKARVFPIEANSEKRVKIVYTQVLPLRGNTYRYAYCLRSEMLRTKPLRELSLTVTINSAIPLKTVNCVTHTARVQKTPNSARVEFVAQEYTPNRDFEVTCEVDHRESDVVVIPHQRGSDGYLLMQLMPPGGEGNWQREIVGEGKPLKLVLLCDTSASMDSLKRQQQKEVIAAILGALGKDDRFQLAAADVETVWADAEPLAPTPENLAKAKDFLDNRVSLGWTDLERAFGEVLKRAPPKATIIYIGDGIVTAGQTDPAAFVQRLGRMVDNGVNAIDSNGKKDEPAKKTDDGKGEPSPTLSQRSFHAITVGNSYDQIVLRGIASLGRGSLRAVTGEQPPSATALELLRELTQPGLRDLKVEFRGVKVAAVYPERLPNLAAGTQQILVGRYLPNVLAQGDQAQQGEVVVTGFRGSEPVRYAARINLASASKGNEAAEGNSFIPRLWARAHLDQLLQQGNSAGVRDEIIALSEEFHIITPFTSLLVLETDADRERFKVKRRFEMRDGEKFFAAGRDNAQYELVQQQMQRAKLWRAGLRSQVLRQLGALGRSTPTIQQIWQLARQRELQVWDSSSTVSYYDNAPMSGQMGGMEYWDTFAGGGGGIGGSTEWFSKDGSMRGSMLRRYVTDGRQKDHDSNEYGIDVNGDAKDYSLGDLGGLDEAKKLMEIDNVEVSLGLSGELDLKLESVKRELRDRDGTVLLTDGLADYENEGDVSELNRGLYTGAMPALEAASVSPFGGRMQRLKSKLELGYGEFGLAQMIAGKPRYFGRGYYGQPDYTAWVNSLFPAIDPARRLPLVKQPEPANWPPEAIALAKSLLRTEALAKLNGGLEIRRAAETFDPRWKRRSSNNRELTLYSPTSWLTRTLDPEEHLIINYCTPKERAVYSQAMLVGRTRASNALDLSTFPLSLGDLSLTPFYEGYRHHTVKLENVGENIVKLSVRAKNTEYVIVFTIDTAKHVLLKHEAIDDGKSTGVTEYSDFVEVGGSWWAKKVTVTNAKKEIIGTTTFEIKSLAADEFTKSVTAELTAKPQVLLLSYPLAPLKTARQNVTVGKAAFADRFTMLLFYLNQQQWDDALAQLTEIEKLAADKPGVRWFRTLIYAAIRRNEEARQRFISEAARFIANPHPQELYMAEFLLGQAGSIASANEYEELLLALQPLYARQPAEWQSLATWQDRQRSALDNLGRPEEALAIQKLLAELFPWETYRQTEYARRLQQAGEEDAAEAWLKKEIARPIERESTDAETLHEALATLYREQTRWQKWLDYTTAWIAKDVENQTAYQEHLSALIFNDKLDEAYALVEKWLKESRTAEKLTAPQLNRFYAAVSFALGSARHLSVNRMDERWYEPLAETARHFSRHPKHFDLASRCFGSQFDSSEPCDRLRGDFLKWLQNDLATLTPQQIEFFVQQTHQGRIELPAPLDGRTQMACSELPAGVWEPLAKQLRAKWEAEKDAEVKNRLGGALRQIYTAHFADTEYLPFLRERVKTAAAEYVNAYRLELFEALLAQTWTKDHEAELFALLSTLDDDNEPRDPLSIQIPALHRLVDALLAGRLADADRKLKDNGEVNKLTRTELAAKRKAARLAARTGLADHLKAEADRVQGTLGKWLRIEQTFLDIALDRNFTEARELCWQLLGEVPPKAPADEDESAQLTPEQFRAQFQHRLLQQRALMTVLNLAARQKAQPQEIDRVLKYLDAGIAQGEDEAAMWRRVKFDFLIALDRADELEKELRAWITADAITAPWRVSLAKLLAERGKLDEAIRLFEAAAKDKLLTASEYRSLSQWYLVRERRQDYERARYETYLQMPEALLAQRLGGLRSRWQNSGTTLPSQIDEETLLALRALFQKSGQPENYLYQLREIYTASRDFRLLQILPDAVMGRSAQHIYAFLTQLKGQILVEIRNEAPTDELLARVRTLRGGERTATDLRALDLIEALVERRCTEVLNQPEPHAKAFLAALKRAFMREWSEGEPVLMAKYLDDLETLRQPELIDEQLRQMRALQGRYALGTREHLQITNHLSHALYWYYGHKGEGLREMEIAVREFALKQKGIWPQEQNQILGDYVTMLENANRHADGETLLKTYLVTASNGQQRDWFKARMLTLYNHALEHKGLVTLGEGQALFEGILKYEEAEIAAAANENTRYQLISDMVRTLDIAHRNKINGAAEQVRDFAFRIIPEALKRQQGTYRGTVTVGNSLIYDVLGPNVALQYLIERAEQYPQRFQISWDNLWNTLGHDLGYRRQQAAEQKLDIRELEPRLLKLVIIELQYELRTGESRNRYLYYRDHQFFWGEKANDFAVATEVVYQERKASGRGVGVVANYMWFGLSRKTRANEMFLIANSDGLLDDSQQVQLITWLQEEKRHAEAIPLLERLVKAHPDVMDYRARLLRAFYHSQRREQMLTLLSETSEHFHKVGRWIEGNIVELGRVCLDCQLYEQAAGYLAEAVSLHQRNYPGSGSGDQALSSLYRALASAYSGLGDTVKAVDAAVGALVSWGPRHNERSDALATLTEILKTAKDLDAYVKHLDEQAAKTNQDNPVVRKAIGQIWQERGDHSKAVAQLEKAANLQPNDKETREALIVSFDRLNKPAEGTRQLLELIDLQRSDLALYQRLAKRLVNDPAQAERAATAIIEAAPHEAENHAALAVLRQEQNRWAEAIPHWEQVAALRKLEPNGLLKLAEAQLYLKQWDPAKKTLQTLQQTEWPSRFQQELQKAQTMQGQIPRL